MIKENTECEFHVLSVYLSPKFTEMLLNTYSSSNKTPTTIYFATLFFNDGLIRYDQYIDRGGVMIGDDEGDFNSQSVVLKKENFVEYFRNLWKRHYN